MRSRVIPSRLELLEELHQHCCNQLLNSFRTIAFMLFQINLGAFFFIKLVCLTDTLYSDAKAHIELQAKYYYLQQFC